METGIDPGLVALLKDNNGGDEKSWWLILLILLMGRKDGLGGGEASCCPPVTLEQLNDAQNAIQNGQIALSNRIGDQTANIIRDLGASSAQSAAGFSRVCESIQAANSNNLIGQKDLTAQIADCCCRLGLSIKDVERAISDSCCETRNAINVQGLQTQNAINLQSCETRNAIERCCCDITNGLAMQTNVLQQAICNDGDKTRALITDNRMQDLQSQLQICRDENSNLRQTATLSDQIRNVCGPPPLCRCVHPHPHGGNGGPPGPPIG